jgi:ribose transport system substrate-binding protein
MSLLLIAGCAQDQGQKAGSKGLGGKLKIGVSGPAPDHSWTAGMWWWAKKAMALYPDVEWSFASAQNPAKQVADIEDMIVKGIDGLVILCTESAPLTPVCEKAHNQGIFILNVDRGFLKKGIADIHFEGDNRAFGRKGAQYVVDQLKGKGKVVMLEGLPCTINTERVEEAEKVFAKNKGIKVLDKQATKWTKQSALEVMETVLKKFSRIDAVYAMDDDVAEGAIQAIKEAKRDQEMFVVGGGGMKQMVKMVMDKDPLVPGDVSYPPSMFATGIHLCVAVLRDGNQEEVLKAMPTHIIMDVDLITPGNAQKYYFPESVY